MNPVETIKYNGKTIEIYQDGDAQNPRIENENADIMICFHKRYNLGDKHKYNMNDFNSIVFNGWDELKKQLVKDYQPVAIKPLYMYDHSGITISTNPYSCPWDSGQIGYVLIPRETALQECLTTKITKKVKEWANNYIKASVKEYDQYLTGEVYGYVIKDENGEELNSCWGFFGRDYVIEEAKGVIDYIPA